MFSGADKGCIGNKWVDINNSNRKITMKMRLEDFFQKKRGNKRKEINLSFSGD